MPTRAQAGKDLVNLLTTVVEEDDGTDPIRCYKLWSHLIELVEQKARDGIAEAQEWLQLKDKAVKGEGLSFKEKWAWSTAGLKWAPQVFKDANIVISTCKNHAIE